MGIPIELGNIDVPFLRFLKKNELLGTKANQILSKAEVKTLNFF